MKKVKCRICGKEDELHYFPEVEKDLMERELCFTCGFWDDIIKTKDSPMSVRINGTQYHIGQEEYSHPNEFRGYSGEKFCIKFNDGKIITTTNLWCNGTIPEHFRDTLTDNAVFLKDRQRLGKEE